MEKTPSRRGRPPGPPQTLPLFLHEVQNRKKQEVIISGFVVRELNGYVEWAGRLTMMAPAEVMVRTMDRALHEYFKRDNPRRCSVCKFKLCPVGEARKLRFHHLRHTTASLLLMQGADLAAVQRIMRHQDPRITTEVYGHLAPGYLKKEIDRLRFEPTPADQGATVIPISASATGSAPSGTDQPVHASAGGASEPPLPADLHTVAAPFSTRFLPNAQIAHAPSTRRLGISKERRGVSESGREDLNLRPFGPEPPPFDPVASQVPLRSSPNRGGGTGDFRLPLPDTRSTVALRLLHGRRPLQLWLARLTWYQSTRHTFASHWVTNACPMESSGMSRATAAVQVDEHCPTGRAYRRAGHFGVDLGAGRSTRSREEGTIGAQ
jgi:integrase-like protein